MLQHTERLPRVLAMSVPVWDVFPSLPDTAHLLGQFRRAINVLSGETVLAFVLPEVGQGPFHIVVEALPDRTLPQTLSLNLEAGILTLGAWQLQLAAPPPLWDPRPHWAMLRFQDAGLEQLRRIARHQARRDTTASPIAAWLLGTHSPRLDALAQAWRNRDWRAWDTAVGAVAGWGPGLTPSGDDFLAGVMLGVWSVGDAGCRVSDTGRATSVSDVVSVAQLPARMYAAAAPRTNRISRAFLAAARDGLADESWHRLLEALASGDASTIEGAARTALDFGASSGLDRVAGFLWLYEQIGAACG